MLNKIKKLKFMKKYFILLLFCVMCICSYAQDMVTSFSMTYFSISSTKKVMINEGKKNSITYFIEIESDMPNEKVYMVLDEKQSKKMLKAMKGVLREYKEWEKNKKTITEFVYEMPFELTKVTYFWNSNNVWYYSKIYEVAPKICLTKDKGALVVINQKVVAHNNENIEQETYLIFNSLQEIEMFINAIDHR